jgi:sorbitol-specific phosphotransferase system component IIA
VHIEDLCWSMGMVYDSRGLARVSTVGPGVDRVLHEDMVVIFMKMYPATINKGIVPCARGCFQTNEN